jgi:hypothetical protein
MKGWSDHDRSAGHDSDEDLRARARAAEGRAGAVIFRGDYFEDSVIIRAWYKGDGEFHIDQKSSGNEDKGIIYYKSTPEERKAFVDELERRMAYREKS